MTLPAPRRVVRQIPVRGRAPGALLFQALGPDGMDLSPRERAVFDALLDHRNHNHGRCNPAVPYLAYHLKSSHRSVQRSLSGLEAKGLIWTAHRAGGWRYTTQWEIRTSWWFHWRAGHEHRMALRYEEAGDSGEAERRRGLAVELEALFRAEVEAEKEWMTAAAGRPKLPWEAGGVSKLEPATPSSDPESEREVAPPKPVEPPAEVEEPAPIVRGEAALSRASVREQWLAAWGESWLGRIPGEAIYRWPSGKRTADYRQHRIGVGIIQEHFDAPLTLRAAFEGYLEQEQQESSRSAPRSHGLRGGRRYGVFPHDEAPSLRKFARSVRTWRLHAAQVGGGGPGPPSGWVALPEESRQRILDYLGVTALPSEVAATLELPGYLDDLVARSTG